MRGVEKGTVDVWARLVKPKDCVSIFLLLLDPGHVILAPPPTNIGKDSTNVVFGCDLIGTICVLIVTSAEAPIAHVLQCTCNGEPISNI